MNKKRTLVMLSLFTMALASCNLNQAHEHIFSEGWETNEAAHWHKAECEHSDLIKDLEDHTFGNDGKCTVCGFEKPHEHTYSADWSKDSENHWHASTCEHTGLTKDLGTHTYNDLGKCTVCGFEKPHEHTYSTDWSKDSENHWHASTCEHTGLTKDMSAHTYNDLNQCTVCGYTKIIPTNYFVINFVTNGGSEIYNITVKENEKLTKPSDPTRNGYRFSGWYMDQGLKKPYDFSSTVKSSFSLYAKWMSTSAYSITYHMNSGTNSNVTSYTVNDSIYFSDPNINGYKFEGWYETSDFTGSRIYGWNAGEKTGNVNLYAKTTLLNYTITYHNVTTSQNPNSEYISYSIESETYTLLDAVVPYKTFGGWFLDSNFETEIQEITKGQYYSDLDIYAKLEPISYKIQFEVNGGSSVSTITGKCGDNIIIPTPEKENFVFAGWFTDTTYSNKFTSRQMPDDDLTLYAKWVEMNTIFEIDTQKYIYAGYYPQTVVSDDNLKTELMKLTTTNDKGYYEFNNHEYIKIDVGFMPSTYSVYYSNGTKVVGNITEFFRVDPILWRVLDCDSSNNYLLLSDLAIDTHKFDSNSSNYANSSIRGWLNGDFYNEAFSTSEQGIIQSTIIDNSAATLKPSASQYACENTNDKVFLLSYKDFLNPNYGFSEDCDAYDSNRCCLTSDIILTRDNDIDKTESKYSSFFTRSPNIEDTVHAVGYNGRMVTRPVNSAYIGIRPAITMKIDNK